MYVQIPAEVRREAEKHSLKLIALMSLVLCLIMAGPIYMTSKEYQEVLRKQEYKKVTGTVVERYMTEYLGILTRPVYVIRPDGANFTVEALLNQNQLFDFRDRVEFYFGGDPAEEVRLIGEEDPLDMIWWFAGIIAVPPLLLLVLVTYRRMNESDQDILDGMRN